MIRVVCCREPERAMMGRLLPRRLGSPLQEPTAKRSKSEEMRDLPNHIITELSGALSVSTGVVAFCCVAYGFS